MEQEERGASGSTSLTLSARDEAWDAGEAKKSLKPEDYAKAFFWRDPEKPADEIGSYKLPFAKRTDTGLVAVWRGVTAAAQRLSATQLPDGDLAGVKTKIGAYYKKAANQYDDDTIVTPWSSSSARSALGELELRYIVSPITHVDVRDPSGNDDDTWTMSGYAAVFNQKTTLYDGKFVVVTETIDPTAFDNVLRSQPLGQPSGVVHLNMGHDMNRSVAATDVPNGQPGNLSLTADSHGLHFLGKVAKHDPDGVAMASKLSTGVAKQASFCFTVSKAELTDTENGDAPDESHRRILEIGHLYDVCVCPQGAYSQTVSQLRSYAAAMGQPAFEREAHLVSQLGGENPVSPRSREAGAASRRLSADLMRRIAKHSR